MLKPANPNLLFLASHLAQGLHLAEVVGGDGKGEEALPGLNYTRQQAFYINIAQVCTMQCNSSTMFQGCFSLSSPPIYISQFFQGYCGRLAGLSEVLLSHLSQHSSYSERCQSAQLVKN